MRHVSISSYSDEFQKIYKAYKIKVKSTNFDRLYKIEDRTEFLLNEKRSELLVKMNEAQMTAMDQPLTQYSKSKALIEFDTKNNRELKLKKKVLIDALDQENKMKELIKLPPAVPKLVLKQNNDHISSSNKIKLITVTPANNLANSNPKRSSKRSMNYESTNLLHLKLKDLIQDPMETDCDLKTLPICSNRHNLQSIVTQTISTFSNPNNFINIPPTVRTIDTNASTFFDLSKSNTKQGGFITSKSNRAKFAQFISNELHRELKNAENLVKSHTSR